MDTSLEQNLFHLPMASVKHYATKSLELSDLVLEKLLKNLRAVVSVTVEESSPLEKIKADRITPIANQFVDQLEVPMGEGTLEHIIDEVRVRAQRLSFVAEEMSAERRKHVEESSVLRLAPLVDSYPDPAVAQLAAE